MMLPAEIEKGVRLSRLLNEINAAFQRYLVLDEAQLVTLALYVVHTHAIEAAYHTPYLTVTSPTPRSGKTRVLEVCNLLVAKSWLCSATTAAALVRKVERVQPTLLLDETDRVFKGNKEDAHKLTGLLNAGYSQSGVYTMCETRGSKVEEKDFHVFCPKVLCGIGHAHLPDTLMSRSIAIEMKRKLNEPVQKFREREAIERLTPIRERIEALVPHLINELALARPAPAPGLNDRAEDSWEPLLAIADRAGEEWARKARQCATVLSGETNRPDADLGVLLLRDIHEVWDEDVPFISTKELLSKLHALEESPWPTRGRGDSPMTPHALAKLLSGFGIVSKSNGHFRGYTRDRFDDAWVRYEVVAGVAPQASNRQAPNEVGAGVIDTLTVETGGALATGEGDIDHSFTFKRP